MTTRDRLDEARAAYHRLLVGDAVVSVTDTDGSRVEYRPATAPRLAAYIETLERQLAGRAATPRVLRFHTSKGL